MFPDTWNSKQDLLLHLICNFFNHLLAGEAATGEFSPNPCWWAGRGGERGTKRNERPFGGRPPASYVFLAHSRLQEPADSEHTFYSTIYKFFTIPFQLGTMTWGLQVLQQTRPEASDGPYLTALQMPLLFAADEWNEITVLPIAIHYIPSQKLQTC